MIYVAVSVYDVIAKVYYQPTYDMNDNGAIRTFMLAIKNNKSYADVKDDLELYKVGSFDTTTGILTPMTPELLLKGRDVALKKKDKDGE